MYVNIANPSLPLPSQEEAGKVSSHTCCLCPVCTKGLCSLVPHLLGLRLLGLMASSPLMQMGNLASDRWGKSQCERAVRSLSGVCFALLSSHSQAQALTLGVFLSCVVGMPVPSLAPCSSSPQPTDLPSKLGLSSASSLWTCLVIHGLWLTLATIYRLVGRGCWCWHLPSGLVAILGSGLPSPVKHPALAIPWHAFWSHQCIIILSCHSGLTKNST